MTHERINFVNATIIVITRASSFVSSLLRVEDVRILHESSIVTQNLGPAVNTRVTRLKNVGRWPFTSDLFVPGSRHSRLRSTGCNKRTLLIAKTIAQRSLYILNHTRTRLERFSGENNAKNTEQFEMILKRFQDRCQLRELGA